MAAVTIDQAQPLRVVCEFRISIPSAFSPDDTAGFASSMTDIDGVPRAWGREEFDYGPIAKNSVYTHNTHCETFSPRYPSASTVALFSAVQRHREWSLENNEIIMTYTPDSPRGIVKVSVHGRGA
jgi:hypothetical protein